MIWKGCQSYYFNVSYQYYQIRGKIVIRKRNKYLKCKMKISDGFNVAQKILSFDQVNSLACVIKLAISYLFVQGHIFQFLLLIFDFH